MLTQIVKMDSLKLFLHVLVRWMRLSKPLKAANLSSSFRFLLQRCRNSLPFTTGGLKLCFASSQPCSLMSADGGRTIFSFLRGEVRDPIIKPLLALVKHPNWVRRLLHLVLKNFKSGFTVVGNVAQQCRFRTSSSVAWCYW